MIADVDECEVENGGCSDICTNSSPGHSCSCSPGFTLDVNTYDCHGQSVHSKSLLKNFVPTQQLRISLNFPWSGFFITLAFLFGTVKFPELKSTLIILSIRRERMFLEPLSHTVREHVRQLQMRERLSSWLLVQRRHQRMRRYMSNNFDCPCNQQAKQRKVLYTFKYPLFSTVCMSIQKRCCNGACLFSNKSILRSITLTPHEHKFPPDIDECLSNNGGCSDTCTNIAGGMQCSCPQGFELDDDRLTCRGTSGLVCVTLCHKKDSQAKHRVTCKVAQTQPSKSGHLRGLSK